LTRAARDKPEGFWSKFAHGKIIKMKSKGVREKYELEIIPIAIGGIRLELYTVKNWDRFVTNLEEKGEAYIKEFPFWVRIWEASIVLAQHLVTIGLEKEMEILEIGAGMGITGLFLGASGHKVTITDHDEDAVELLRMNVELNGLRNVSVKRLDWDNPDLTTKYDMICGSELVYTETSIQPIIDLLRAYLQPAGMVFLAHDVERMCMIKFIGTVPGRFDIQNVVKTFKGENAFQRIVVHTLRLKE
jgi:predicted nicotinamide N-methyase